MLYYSGKPLLEWNCHDRRVIETLWRSGSSPSSRQVVGASGRRMPWGISYTCWRLVGLSKIVRWLAAGWWDHQLAFSVASRTGLVRGCHFFLAGWWPWGSFMVTDSLVDGGASLLVRSGRLRYYLMTTSDHSVLLGRCYLKIFGREIFLGHVVLTRLGEVLR